MRVRSPLQLLLHFFPTTIDSEYFSLSSGRNQHHNKTDVYMAPRAGAFFLRLTALSKGQMIQIDQSKLDVFSDFAETIYTNKYAHDLKTREGKEKWPRISRRTAKAVFSAVEAPKALVDETTGFIRQRKWMPAGRYLYASGRPYHQVNNCALFKAEDSREGWSELMHDVTMSLMSGAGIGVVYSYVRERGRKIRKTGGFATGPIALMKMVNESGREIMQGGARRSAIWAGLHWWHPDILEFIHLKDWAPEIVTMKEKDFSAWAPMDQTNISVILDDEFFAAYHNDKHPKHSHAHMVYWEVMKQMLSTGEPGFSIDVGENAGECLRNACTEICSRDNNDICNLGSVNMARIRTLDEFRNVLRCGTAYLLAGTAYSLLPFPAMDRVRDKNRRLGVGLMGIHEWLMIRGKPYGPDDELTNWLEVYVEETDRWAEEFAKEWEMSIPVKKRSIAPNGTIGIVAETTTGIEPMFCAAFKRRYMEGQGWRYQYVIEAIAKRMVEEYGIKPDDLEDAYTLAADPERRLAFQAYVQQYVDHGISSTLNLPAWGSPHNCEEKVQEFGRIFMKYLPKLRGITCYPDGARGGQPLTPVKWATAQKHLGEVFVESADVCEISGKGGSCGG